MLESIVVLTILSIALLFSVPLLKHDVSLYAFEEWFISDMSCLQQQAYLQNESYLIEVNTNELKMKHLRKGVFDGSDIKVTSLGKVSRAASFYAESSHQVLRWKVWLANGRVHFER